VVLLSSKFEETGRTGKGGTIKQTENWVLIIQAFQKRKEYFSLFLAMLDQKGRM